MAFLAGELKLCPSIPSDKTPGLTSTGKKWTEDFFLLFFSGVTSVLAASFHSETLTTSLFSMISVWIGPYLFVGFWGVVSGCFFCFVVLLVWVWGITVKLLSVVDVPGIWISFTGLNCIYMERNKWCFCQLSYFFIHR